MGVSNSENQSSYFSHKEVKDSMNLSREDIISMAFKFHASGKLIEAIKYYQYFIDQGFSDPRVFSNYGVICQQKDQTELAVKLYRKSITLFPDKPEAYYNLASVLRELGHSKEPERLVRKSIQIKPEFAEAHSLLGNIFKDLGRIEDAKLSWIKAIKLDPKLKKTIFVLSQQLFYETNYELAIKYLDGIYFGRCQSLYLSCLLSLDRENDFHQKVLELSKKKLCNAEIGGVIEHANIIYKKKNFSPFCNESMKYVMLDKISEDMFSEHHFQQLIDYIKSEKIFMRSQGILNHGVQTSGNLFKLEYPFIKSIKKALMRKIDLYRLKYKDSKQGFIENWPKDYELRSWMISMKNGGFLKQHNHEYGWITGSFYLQVPQSFNDDGGSIAFSYQGPQYPVKDKLFNLTIKKLEVRDICIFPSSLFHQTIPFESDIERICFVFDLVQIGN